MFAATAYWFWACVAHSAVGDNCANAGGAPADATRKPATSQSVVFLTIILPPYKWQNLCEDRPRLYGATRDSGRGLEARMLMRRLVVLGIPGLTLLLPAVCSGQIYGGASIGAGGANASVGSYASGYRGALRLYGGYE